MIESPEPCGTCGVQYEHEAGCPVGNAERAARGRAALEAYGAEVGIDEANLCDLLADLMHAAGPGGWDFNEELGRARHHYNHEAGTPHDKGGA